MATVSKPTKAFSDIVAHTRGSQATYVDSTGSIVTVGPDTPRTNHHVYDGAEWVNAGLLIEGEDRTNLLVGSASPATQDITISTIAPHTLHFTGDGSVSLSGVYTGSLSGTGTGEENRVSLTFTPDSTGTLTVTVTGTVTNGQLELGESPSSYIETTTTPVTRSRDNFTVYPESLPDVSSTNAMTIQMSGSMDHTNSGETVFYRWYEDESNQFAATLDQSSGTVTFTHSGDDSVSGAGVLTDGSSFSIGGVYTDSRVAGAVNGVLTGENTAPTSVPSLNSTGVFELGHQFMGTMSSLRIWGEDVGDTGLVQLTEPPTDATLSLNFNTDTADSSYSVSGYNY